MIISSNYEYREKTKDKYRKSSSDILRWFSSSKKERKSEKGSQSFANLPVNYSLYDQLLILTDPNK